jgi:hypothetical protein
MLHNNNTINNNTIKKCGFCKLAGHNIIKCNNYKTNEIYNRILRATVFTGLFPFIENVYIKNQLSQLSTIEMKVISYKFNLPKMLRKKIKNKESLFIVLFEYLHFISKNQEIMEPYFSKINEMYTFSFINPTLIPNTRYVTEFADNIQELFSNQPEYLTHIMCWHASNLQEFYFQQQSYNNLLTLINSSDYQSVYSEPMKYNITILIKNSYLK